MQQSHGGKATHMPRIYGSQYNKGNDKNEIISGKDFTEDVVPSTEAIRSPSQIQIRRCTQARNIREACEEERDALEKRYRLELPNLVLPTVNYSEPQYRRGISQAQFEGIRNHLFTHRSQLALDTMHYRIPDYQLLWYINQHGRMAIDPAVWRGFLQRCKDEKTLFSWLEVGDRPYVHPPLLCQNMSS